VASVIKGFWHTLTDNWRKEYQSFHTLQLFHFIRRNESATQGSNSFITTFINGLRNDVVKIQAGLVVFKNNPTTAFKGCQVIPVLNIYSGNQLQ